MSKIYTPEQLQNEYEDYDFVKLPTWAVAYLVNADDSGLDDDQIAEVDDFFDDMLDKDYRAGVFEYVELLPNGKVKIVDDPTPHHEARPAFGKPCDCFTVMYSRPFE